MLSSELSATEKEEILNDVTSRLWFTYRRNFPPIDWRWNKQEPRGEYLGILTAFLDKKDSYYSIHQIAQMGVGEGKYIGQWYGPNTVAQVLRKLTAFDQWSSIAVHIAMDNTVVTEEIREYEKSPTQAKYFFSFRLSSGGLKLSDLF
ncbi:hypothetical protein AB205_0195260 [Aquarana catesbeiana]|uniref:Cysteine protease n=1 Tax=Aquarana catesbeiana TaxID=8400 RepID=A0A2G9P1P2_AQUCT|nr:hypothetical protein AB205_0195260 [Aquarana catesbeiana]PIN97234.1 hypothetical protein AB205_0195260 [Aquarana catesbeiana]